MEKTETPADLRRRLGDGRQYGISLKEIKENHRKRYNWAADRLRGQPVVDAGCGVGYGSWILGEHCPIVTGLDFNPHVIDFATQTWRRPNVQFQEFNLQSGYPLPPSQAVVAFEVIEHLVCPESLLCSIPKGAILLGSVPNRDFAPHSIASNPFHIRHYTYADLETLLSNCGFHMTVWYHQGLAGPVSFGQKKAQTILFSAERTTNRQPDWQPNGLQRAVIDALQFELLRRCNVIGDLKKNATDTRGPTAF